MDYREMFNVKLIGLEIDVASREELFAVVAAELGRERMVEEGYLSGILKREAEFPTGLITQHLNIALPHTDPQYIRSPFIYVARLKNAVSCKQMGDDQPMEVKDFFFLGIKDVSGQVGLLQGLVELFAEEDVVNAYQKAQTAEDVYQLMVNHI